VTLVLSLITRDHALQVSDRRLVNLASGGLADEHTNKSVLYHGHAAFGYTGLAKLGRNQTRSDLWLAEALTGTTGATALQRMVDATTHGLAETPTRREWKRHAFAGVGWGQSEPGRELQPYICCVSNYLSDEGKWLRAPRDECVGVIEVMGTSQRYLFLAIGQSLSEEERGQLMRNIDRALSHSVGPVELARLLVEQARGVAPRNRSVGRALLLTSLPRSSMTGSEHQGNFFLASEPAEGEKTFLYIPADKDEGMQYGPTYVGATGTMTNFFAQAF
jgi:hypothetical protein